MPDQIVLTSTLSTLVLALPFAVLALLLALLFRAKSTDRAGRAAKFAPRAEEPGVLERPIVRAPHEGVRLEVLTLPEPPQPLPLVAEPAERASLVPDDGPLERAPPSAVPLEIAPLAAAPIEDVPSPSEPLGEGEDEMIKHIGPIPDPKTPDELHLDIQTAERAGNHALLARLCLDLAQATPSDPRIPEVLRKCVRAAMRSKSFAVHAAARLELAERARLAGDLTTACEHWQIARGLFFDMNDRDLHKTAEGLMLRHGCPTDWVLTDF